MAFKDYFIKSDEPTSSVQPKTQPNDVEKQSNQVSNPISVPTQAGISSNDEIVGQIWQVVVNKNLPGPDYLELKNNVKALDSMPLTDEQKLISAFNILKANYPSFNKDVILRSIDTYTGIVQEEKNKGLVEVSALRAEKIEGKEKLIETLKVKADALKKEYDDILKQINEHTTSVATERLSIDNQERVFTASVETVLNTLNSDKTKISSINI